jgi:RNA polymerase sigma-70 factor (ECF subfamily)
MGWELANLVNSKLVSGPLAGLVGGERRVKAACPMDAMDSEAFAGFYERSARPLWAYLARTSGDPALADDLMQEAYLRFLGAAWAGDGEVAYRKYLFRIATNLLKDHWRRPKTSSIEDAPEAVLASGDKVGQTEAQEVLNPALAKLTARDRQLLWLAHAEGYSHREIAEITGLGAASIRLLLFRARGRIAKLLREQNEEPGVARDGVRWLA